jgi:DTW domain-containing protein
MLLGALERRPDIAETLNASFERMLARYREVEQSHPELTPRPKPRKNQDRRRPKRSF